MKFDGVHGNKDRELSDPMGFGRIEYAYHLMVREAGIEMEDCRLHEEGGRAHFMTRRFDREPQGGKLHMQSLGAMMHFDFNVVGTHAYEQALLTIRRLELPAEDIEQQVRRAYFNVLARNQDDHVKNIAFLMSREGLWRLSPAFDVAYSYNPSGAWTGRHQMSLNGKRDGFEIVDLIAFAGVADVKKTRANAILGEVTAAVFNWRRFAEQADVTESDVNRIENAHRRELVTTQVNSRTEFAPHAMNTFFFSYSTIQFTFEPIRMRWPFRPVSKFVLRRRELLRNLKIESRMSTIRPHRPEI